MSRASRQGVGEQQVHGQRLRPNVHPNRRAGEARRALSRHQLPVLQFQPRVHAYSLSPLSPLSFFSPTKVAASAFAHPIAICSPLVVLCRRSQEREPLFVSLNRYERKKNIGLALQAFALLRERTPKGVFASLRLVIAGNLDLLQSCADGD